MRRALAAAILLLTPCSLLAQMDPTSLPAHDSHGGFLVACDLYAEAARVKQRMGKDNPLEAGILPIELYLRNNTGKAIRVDLTTIRLLLHPPDQDHQDLEPLAIDDLINRIVNKGSPPDVTGRRTPFPHPPKAGRSRKWRELNARLSPLVLDMNVVPPGATMHGFLFFDLGHHYDLLQYAHLYVPNVKFLEGNQPLFYFEVDLAAAARH